MQFDYKLYSNPKTSNYLFLDIQAIIVGAAIAHDDQQLLLNFKGIVLIAKEAKFNRKCRSKIIC